MFDSLVACLSGRSVDSLLAVFLAACLFRYWKRLDGQELKASRLHVCPSACRPVVLAATASAQPQTRGAFVEVLVPADHGQKRSGDIDEDVD